MTTDLKTVLGSQCHWLTKGTVVKIIVGSREGYIGKILHVWPLSVAGCIYKVVLNVHSGFYQDKPQYQKLVCLYTQEQVVEYTQVEFCAGGQL